MPADFDERAGLFNSLNAAAAMLRHYESMLQDGHIELVDLGLKFPYGCEVCLTPEHFVACARGGVEDVIAWMREQSGIKP
jgi:hypothetical protein